MIIYSIKPLKVFFVVVCLCVCACACRRAHRCVSTWLILQIYACCFNEIYVTYIYQLWEKKESQSKGIEPTSSICQPYRWARLAHFSASIAFIFTWDLVRPSHKVQNAEVLSLARAATRNIFVTTNTRYNKIFLYHKQILVTTNIILSQRKFCHDKPTFVTLNLGLS